MINKQLLIGILIGFLVAVSINVHSMDACEMSAYDLNQLMKYVLAECEALEDGRILCY